MEILIKKKRPHILHVPFVRHINAKGEILWEQGWTDNIWHDEGEQALLSAYFATTYSTYGAPPANLYLGLDARNSLAEADTLATVNAAGEPSGNGYARGALSTAGTGAGGQDFVISQPGVYYEVTSKTVTFTAITLAWIAVKNMFLCTVISGTSGKLLGSLALTATRTLQVGDSLQTSIIIGISE